MKTIPNSELEIPGVKFNEPPVHHIPAIRDAVRGAFEHLPEGAKGGLFALVNEKGANAVIVTRAPLGFEIQAYIGKTWKGSTEYGANVMKVW
jgi:hypothetical protein